MKASFDKLMIRAAYLYTIIPFLLFCVGWLRWYYTVPAVLILIACYLLVIKATTEYIYINLKKHSATIIISLIVILTIVLFSGIGEYSYQTEDHLFRNSVFHDLVTHNWPYRLNESGNFPHNHQPILFIYYIEYWFPAALIGKIAGWEAAKFFLYLWTVIGTTLTFYFLCRLFKRVSLKILFLFFFFNTLYIFVSFVKYPVMSVISSDYKVWSDFMLLAGSNIDALFWIYNQTVTPLLIIALILNNVPKQNVGFLYALCYLHGPFCFIGFFPYLCIMLYRDIVANKASPLSFAQRLAPYLTFQNLAGSLVIVFFSYCYLAGSPAVQPLFFAKLKLFKYLLFIAVEFGLISILIFNKYKRDPFYYATIAMLLILPLIAMGNIQPFTFCVRVSIVPMFMLMIFVTRFLLEERPSITRKLVLLYVSIAAIEPFLQIGRSVTFTIGHYIDPLATNKILYDRAGEWSNWRKLVPDQSQWKTQNFNKLNFVETQDTSITPNLPLYEMQTDTPFFSRYLLKQK